MSDVVEVLQAALADRYTVMHELGRGGMASVYLAEDLKHHRQVALKVLRPDLAAALGSERFLREIDIAAKLSHPHIVPVYDSGQANGLLFFTMPFIEGSSLRHRLNAGPPIAVDEALRIAGQVVTALSYAHRQGVVHRDIKPENILFSGGVVVVADFGIARAVNAAGGGGLTASGFPLGTLGYMSPEQAAGSRSLDGRSDIYSLGCVLYEMLVGRPPERWLDQASLDTGKIADAEPGERKQLDSLPEPVEQLLVRALAQAPDARFRSADELGAAISRLVGNQVSISAPPYPLPAPRIRWRRPVGTLAAIVILIAGAVGVASRWRSGPALDPNVVAVAPFDALGPDLNTWREGLVDLVSAPLDGAGPLRAVPPSAVIGRWSGRADAVSAADLGEELGAGLVLFGRLIGAGSDSVRVVATLLDVTTRRAVAEFDVRDRVDRVDRIADALVVGIISDLSRTRGLSGWHPASIGSSSPVALKAFLQGEQHHRRFGLDSARWYYARAIEADSAFALAHSRLAMASGWSMYFDADVAPGLLRAGALNHGLARRESLLLAGDSLWGALSGLRFRGEPDDWERLRRIVTTLETATTLYPTDPRGWYALGEIRYHFGPYVGIMVEQARAAFTRAVELDSAYVPAYKHLIELSLLTDDRESARRAAVQYVRRADSSMHRDAAAVTAALLDPERAMSTETQERLGALSTEGLANVWYDLKWWIDPAETSVRVAEALTARDSAAGGLRLALALAYRGRLEEARALAGAGTPALYVVLARLGAIPPDSVRAQLAAWLDADIGSGILAAHRWWALDGDTVSLQRSVQRWDSVARLPVARPALYEAIRESAQGYLALARADTATALERLATVPMWPGRYDTYYEQLTRAQILARGGEVAAAARLLDRMPFATQFDPAADAILTQLERGRVHERLGNRDTAIEAYARVVDAWSGADAVLQPLVSEAREALSRLTKESRE
jgi:serine/threonine-protein kinase